MSKVGKFRKNPVVIEAVQLTRDYSGAEGR
jgi:hypothetical protein